MPTPRALELGGRVGGLVREAEAVLSPGAALDLARLVRTFTLRSRDGFVETFGPALLARVGKEAPGVRLTFDKRYITLAPVASLIGLAFRMYDPDGLIGDTRDIGITLALLPRDTAGVDIGRRHFPLNSPFQNGPIHGKDVFIPMSQLIGGAEKAGQRQACEPLGGNAAPPCHGAHRTTTVPCMCGCREQK